MHSIDVALESITKFSTVSLSLSVSSVLDPLPICQLCAQRTNERTTLRIHRPLAASLIVVVVLVPAIGNYDRPTADGLPSCLPSFPTNQLIGDA